MLTRSAGGIECIVLREQNQDSMMFQTLAYPPRDSGIDLHDSDGSKCEEAQC
jgi:hypothetical protein